MVTKLRRGLLSLLCVLAVLILASYQNQKQEHVLSRDTRSQEKIKNEEFVTKKLRPLRVLTLGGSVTWGAAIPDRRRAYPFRLKNDEKFKVTNLAIRGTGSGYPAQCISSMLQKKEEDNVPFDVVIFEFSVNGMEHFELLLNRIRERYPDAILIYVDLWSLTYGKMDSSEATRLVKEANGFVYFFNNEGPALDFFDYGGIAKDKPKSKDTIDLFAGDKHHLSYSGHDLVKTKIMEIIHSQDIPSEPRLGSWLGGDDCRSWFTTGQDYPFRISSGAHINKFDKSKNKWALEIEKDGALLEYMNRNEEGGQFNLQFMTKSTDKFDPKSSKYPPVYVLITQSSEEINEYRGKAKRGELQFTTAWDFRDGKVIDNGKVLNNPHGNWTYVSPLHFRRGMRTFHVTDSKVAGTINPGHNYIFVFPASKTEWPFRITATVLCSACTVLGLE